MGYKVHSVDGKSGEVDLTHLRKRTASIYVPAGAAGTYPLCKVPVAATVTAVRAWRVGGTSCSVNATSAGGSALASDLTAGAGTWASSTSIQTAAAPIAAGDTLSAVITAVSGSPTGVTVEIDYTVSVP
jgi:hypothetical protein